MAEAPSPMPSPRLSRLGFPCPCLQKPDKIQVQLLISMLPSETLRDRACFSDIRRHKPRSRNDRANSASRATPSPNLAHFPKQLRKELIDDWLRYAPKLLGRLSTAEAVQNKVLPCVWLHPEPASSAHVFG